MGLFDKIKDNAKSISMRAIESTREYDEDYLAEQQAGSTVTPSAPVAQPEPVQDYTQDDVTMIQTAPSEPENAEDDVEFLIGETEQPANQEPTPEPAPEPEEEPARKSKVIEIPKEEHEKTEKAKRQEKAKQAAKERLAKSYTPSYKQDKNKVEVKTTNKSAKKIDEPEPSPTTAKKASKPVGIVDITPKKMPDPLKGAIYARERAALSALASQRKLNGTVPLYEAAHMNFRTKVFINRVEYSGSFGKVVLPIEQIVWIKVRHGGTGVILETTEGKRVVMVVKQADRLPFVDAVMKVQAMQPKRGKFKDTQTVRIDKLEQFGEGIDEIEKLAKLYDKGILSHEEFEAKKKQILGI